MSANYLLLLDMGFPEALAEKAIKETGDSSIEAAMDWLMAHQNENDTQEAAVAATENTAEPMDSTAPPEGGEPVAEATSAVAKSIKCDECGKLFRTSEEIEFHAAKTNHSKFSESTDEKKPLTEEEKKEQLKKVEELMKQKRKEREEKEKADQLERERQRIQSGKELSIIKKKLEDEQLKKMAEERRREKEEEKKARQRVKDMIEQDKLARKQKFATSSPDAPVSSAAATPSAPMPASSPSSGQPKEYKETRIQIRLANGSAVTQTFAAKEQLAAVRLFVDMKRTELADGQAAVPYPFRLQTNFPKKIFSDEDYDKPLDVLGLVPSAVLMVSRG